MSVTVQMAGLGRRLSDCNFLPYVQCIPETGRFANMVGRHLSLLCDCMAFHNQIAEAYIQVIV
jgi:hypothetical protein